MSKTVSKFALAASIVLAMAFTVSCIGDDSSAFVGKWVLDDGSRSVELFKDGTGVNQERKGKKNDMSMSISWKLVDKRFVVTTTILGSLVSQAYDYEISGNKLTLTDDKGEIEIYVRPQEGKIEGKTLTDNRDGKKYKTVIIGTQTWMAENLNYEAKESKCYDDKPENCSKYGRLYNWYESDDGFCPYGWHLPNDAEWGKLTGFIGNDAGNKLKATNGWSGNGNGTDNYGFSALPGGWCNSNGNFFKVDSNGSWWSDTEYKSDNASSRNMLYNGSLVGTHSSDKSNLYSVRCVQDKVKPVGDYKGGKEHGEWKFFYENGNLRMIVNFKDGKTHGEWKYFHENGNLRSVGNYIDDKQQGEWKYFHENKNLETVENYKDDKLQGEWKSFYENGNLERVGNYIDDKLHGEWKFFYENGNLKAVGNLIDDKRHGEWKFFYKNGNLDAVQNFKDGVLQR